MNLEIVNDTELHIECNITINGKNHAYTSDSKSTSYEINPQKDITNIQFIKENVWGTKGTLNSLFLILYIFDLVFGNLCESNNLPFSINHQLNLTTKDCDSSYRVLLSNIVKVDPNSLKRWKKYSMFQCCMVSTLIFLIGLILSFIFTGWGQIAFLTCFAFLSICMYKLVNKQRKTLLKVLIMFL